MLKITQIVTDRISLTQLGSLYQEPLTQQPETFEQSSCYTPDTVLEEKKKSQPGDRTNLKKQLGRSTFSE